MTSNDIVSFIKQAATLNLSATDIQPLLKKATGQDVDPQQIEQLLAQHGQGEAAQHPDMSEGGIDPHELHQLEQQFGDIDPHELAQIAQELEQYLAQHGDDGQSPDGMPAAMEGAQENSPADGGGMPKISSDSSSRKALASIQTAPYIFGFLKHATDSGVSVKNAVALYGEALANTIEQVKEAEYLEQHADKVDEKVAAYCQGVAEKAAAAGLSFEQTVELLKQSGIAEKLTKSN